jgi:glucosamine--fructose-6-phosphate aminotransferase (isomerizing)
LSSGIGKGETFVASDVPAILAHTRQVVFLDDREMVIITPQGATFTDVHGTPHPRTPQTINWDPVMAEKAGYKHFMLKEIYEQPWAVRETILGRGSVESGRVFLDEMKLDAAALREIDRVVMLACGTSWHSALIGKFLIEELARIPVEVDYGSEYRYRDPIVDDRTLAIVITQSGETADTLAALREAKQKGARSISICNVVGSMATRETDGTVYTHAGPEIGVASTKAFTSQLVALHLLAIHLGQVRGTLSTDRAIATSSGPGTAAGAD